MYFFFFTNLTSKMELLPLWKLVNDSLSWAVRFNLAYCAPCRLYTCTETCRSCVFICLINSISTSSSNRSSSKCIRNVFLFILYHMFRYILHIWKMASYIMLHKYFFDKMLLFALLFSMCYRNK